ncbi:MAG: haloacid dehalogenase type II [Acidimicrobiales bacterium]
MTPTRPLAIAFDVVGTLFSLRAVRARLAGQGGDGATFDLWFARLLRDAFALTAAGSYRPFRDVAGSSLRAVLPSGTDELVDHVLAGFGELEPEPDAEPAMRLAVEDGVRVLTLTNGGADTTAALLARAGLDRLVEHQVSVEAVSTFKPAAAPYRHAASLAGVEPDRLALVAAHAWDVHGARQAGLVTGWVARAEGSFPPAFDRPDVIAPDLAAVTRALIDLG